jgi:hypothetical protein
MAISQAVTVLAKTRFSGAARVARVCGSSREGSATAQMKTWVSSSRSGCLALERQLHAVRQWIAEIGAEFDLVRQQAERAGGGSFGQGHQAREGTSGLGDDDFFAAGGALDELRQVGLGFVEVDGVHGRCLGVVELTNVGQWVGRRGCGVKAGNGAQHGPLGEEVGCGRL